MADEEDLEEGLYPDLEPPVDQAGNIDQQQLLALMFTQNQALMQWMTGTLASPKDSPG